MIWCEMWFDDNMHRYIPHQDPSLKNPLSTVHHDHRGSPPGNLSSVARVAQQQRQSLFMPIVESGTWEATEHLGKLLETTLNAASNFGYKF